LIERAVSAPEVSVVVPVYRTREALCDLHRRLTSVLEGLALPYEIVFVDDACPLGSREVLARLAAEDGRVVPLLLSRNVGQHHAVWKGLDAARGSRVVILDGDGQDPPEAIPLLLGSLVAPVEAVFAGRRGAYESRGRLLTSRLFKTLLGLLTGLPRDAGMFVALSRRMVERILEFDGSRGSIVAMIGAARLPVASVPVLRAPRPEGASAYSSWGRVVAGCRALAFVLLPGRRAGDPRAHNAAQREYFETRDKPNMRPSGSPYINRHVVEMVRAAGLRPEDRVLEVGCGMGRYTLPLAERGLSIEGLDLSPVLLDRLREFDGGRHVIPLHVSDVADPAPALDGRYDAVIGMFALHHMHDLPRCFEGMVRMLRPGGRIVFLEPNAFNPLYYLQIAFTPGITWQGDGGVARMRPAVVLGAMARAGLVNLTVERFGFFPPVLANRRWGRRVEAILEGVPPLRPVLPFQLFRGERV
jgi:SAM-dependent methyltransferase